MKKLKEFLTQRSYFLVLAALMLAILSGIEFNRQAEQAANNGVDIIVIEK